MHDILFDTNNIVPLPGTSATTEGDFEPHQYIPSCNYHQSSNNQQSQQPQQRQQQHQQLEGSTSTTNPFESKIDVEDIVDCFTSTEALEMYEEFAFGAPISAVHVPSSSSDGLDVQQQQEQQQEQQQLEPLPLAVPSSLLAEPYSVPSKVASSNSGALHQFDSVFDNTPPREFNTEAFSSPWQNNRCHPRSSSQISISPSPTTATSGEQFIHSTSQTFSAAAVVTPETSTLYFNPGSIVDNIDSLVMQDMPPLPEAEGSVFAGTAYSKNTCSTSAGARNKSKVVENPGGGKSGGAIASGGKSTTIQRFKPFHEEKWDQRLNELLHFRRQYGHTLVPHTFHPNPQLARWVKRQRRQYKLLQSGKASTMTADRVVILEDAGFVWDSHEVSWKEKVQELIAYKDKYGNCLVPSSYRDNPQLATWVKCQRRQYKLYGEVSAWRFVVTHNKSIHHLTYMYIYLYF